MRSMVLAAVLALISGAANAQMPPSYDIVGWCRDDVATGGFAEDGVARCVGPFEVFTVPVESARTRRRGLLERGSLNDGSPVLDRPPAFQMALPLTINDRQRSLLDRLTQSGYDPLEPPILQDATHFLELGGEDIRGSLYFTSDRSGAELCLRPEYTIPVCRAYLDSASVGRPASFSYCGPVFRLRSDAPGEFVQAGLESYGREDTAAADAEILGVALDATEAAGSGTLAVRFGDAGLLAAVLDTLRLPPNWQRRLKRGLDKGDTPAVVLAAAPGGASNHSGVLAALAGANAKDAHALVHDLLAIAGIDSVGGRSAEEIAERFLAQVALQAAPPFSDEHRAILDRFLSIAGDPDEAAVALRALATDATLDLGSRVDLFEERTSFMAAHGVDLGTVTYDAAFGRNLDYYTGFVFEARHQGEASEVVIGGGRYDGLAQALGHSRAIPAVGAAIWPGRIRTPEGRPA